MRAAPVTDFCSLLVIILISRHASLENDIMLGSWERCRASEDKAGSVSKNRWPHRVFKQLVRKAQDRSAYQRFVHKVAHARNSGTASWVIDWLILIKGLHCIIQNFKWFLFPLKFQWQRASFPSPPPLGWTPLPMLNRRQRHGSPYEIWEIYFLNAR